MHLLGHSLEDRHPLHTQQAVHSCVGQIILHRTVYHHGAQDNVEVPLDTLLENHVDDDKKNGEKTKDSLTCTVGVVPHTTLDQVETTEHKWVDLSLEGLEMHNKVTREALRIFKDEMHIQQERKSAADQRWLSAPTVAKLENTSASTRKNSENHQKQVQRCQQVPH